MSGPSGATTERGAGIFAPLAHATFRGIWISSTVSNTGSLIQSVAAAWVMAEISTADDVALVQTASFLPMALLALPAGAIADIYDRRRVQITFLTLSLLSALALAIVSKLGLITPWLLLALCFLVGSGGALSAPARGASVGEQVPKELLPQAVGLNNISYNLARSLGPAIGGVIVAMFGATLAFVINAASYLPMLESLRRWRREADVSRLPPEGLFRSISSGLRYIVNMQPVRRALLRVFIICFLGAALQSLLPLIARDLLGGNAKTFGLLLGSFGVGAVCGIFVLQPVREAIGNEKTLWLCCLAMAVSLAVLSVSGSLYLNLVVLWVAGLAWMLTTTTVSITVQLFVPRWVMGRAIATTTAATSLGVASGSWVWGLLAHDFGLPLAYQVAAAGLAASLLLTFVLPVADRTASTELDEREIADPDIQLGISGRSGPVSIEIQYRIDAKKARDFYHLMREVRTTRVRNGSYHWSLSRNIADPEIWSERFTCPTWDDYLRLRNRRTLEDTALHQRARAMHIGIEPIRITRWLDRPFGSVRRSDEVPDRGDDALLIEH